MIKLTQKDTIDDKFAMIDCQAEWCSPCRLLSPLIEKLEPQFPDIKFYSLDIDENRDLAKKLNIRAVPTLILLKNNLEVNRAVGMQTIEKLQKFLQSAK